MDNWLTIIMALLGLNLCIFVLVTLRSYGLADWLRKRRHLRRYKKLGHW